MNEATKKINDMIKSFNSTFNISVDINDKEVNNLKIDELKNDGSEFVNLLFNIFGQIVSNSDPDYELIYDEKKGLAIAKKVIKVDYIIEE